MRDEPDADRAGRADDRRGDWLRLLLDRLPEPVDLDGRDLAGLRRAQAGASAWPSTTPPTDEVKADQKDFFGLLYHLLVGAERGPRLPTLILALGPDRVRALLGG